MSDPAVTRFPDARLLIFAKAPVPGQVKSRLVPDIGEHAAAELHRLMTLNTVVMAVNSGICPVELWCSPDPSHQFFQKLGQRVPVTLRTQQGSDLGERMFHAAGCALQEANSIIIIGSDCLQITNDHLAMAMAYLAEQSLECVVAPAYDGGYVLIGMNKIDRRLFQNIDWGTSDVMKQTQDALRGLQWRWAELPTLRDTDVKTDLLHILSSRDQYRPDPGIDSLLQDIIFGQQPKF